MSLIKKIKYLYLLLIFVFSVLYVFSRPRPKLKSLYIDENSAEFNHNSKINIKSLEHPNNKVSIGYIFSIKENDSWYQVIQLSFWRKEYLNLQFLDDQLNITNVDLRIINDNNYAAGTFQGQDIVYSCMKDSGSFNYRLSKPKVVDSFDFNHWKKIYINNLDLVFYSFKPKNYECYVVLTSDTNFFENSAFEINKKIFNKFIY